MDITKKTSEFKALSRVAIKAELMKIHLLSCKVTRSIDALDYSKVNAKINFSGDLHSKSSDNFTAIVKISINGCIHDEEDKDIIVFDCEYMLNYALTEENDLPDEDIEIFCSMNAIYNAWPFCRELLQSMTQRMELPVLTLPLLKFRPPKPSHKKCKNKDESN